MNNEEKNLLIRRAEEYIQKWKSYLWLSDWQISVKIVSTKSIIREGGCGCAIATHNHAERKLVIEIGDQLGKCMWGHGLEDCIIHEMMHAAIDDPALHTLSISQNAAFKNMIETICNQVAYIILRLERELGKKTEEGK